MKFEKYIAEFLDDSFFYSIFKILWLFDKYS